ncbi:MAG TPA: energy transducer TonB, partial [Blastocatellia bacterium]
YPLNEVTLLFPTDSTGKDQAKSGAGFLGGSLRTLRRPGGGGGGNDRNRTSRGVPPAASDTQLAQPSPELPDIARSSLVIRPTVIADPNSLLSFKGPVGMLDSPPEAPPSRGSGPGSGIGQGKDAGYGPGSDNNVGGGPRRDGGGLTNGSGTDVYVFSDKLRPTILYRERAKYTEQARLNRVQGTVLLTIVFGADGRIHDVRTVRGLPYGLTETSIEAARKMRFHPAVLDGKPVSVRATLEFNFALY